MRNLFKICFATFFVVSLMLNVANAEKTDWEDKSYNFSRARKVMVYDLNNLDKGEFNDDVMFQVIDDEFWKQAKRFNNYTVVEGVGTPKAGQPVEGADLYVITDIIDWHDDSYVRPGYTSWETRHDKRRVRRSDGSSYDEDYSYSVPVHHPPRTVYTSTVRVRFSVFDARTGKRVFARDDNRDRDDRYAQKGMFGRIAHSFFEDLNKKLRKDY